jgi:hypothetical protein
MSICGKNVVVVRGTRFFIFFQDKPKAADGMNMFLYWFHLPQNKKTFLRSTEIKN